MIIRKKSVYSIRKSFGVWWLEKGIILSSVRIDSLVGDALLVVAIDAQGAIRENGPEDLDAREERELEESISLSLATASVAAPESPRVPSVPKPMPPSRPTTYAASRPLPYLERPIAALPFGEPSEPAPPPPDRDPAARQRVEAYRRAGALPTLFPPTGSAWPNSPIYKARPQRSMIRYSVFVSCSPILNGWRISRA